MGIPERKEREKEARRRQIQQAANELFLHKGFNSTTMEDIANKAELSPGTIYQYFKNKEELYASLNVIHASFTLSQVEQVANNDKLSPEEKIIALKDGMYKAFHFEPLILRNIFHMQLEDSLPTLSKDLLEQIVTLTHKIMLKMAEVYEEGVRKGKFREGHSMAHADIIWATFTGLVVWEEAKRKLNPKKDFIKSTLDKAFEIFLRGIKKD